MIFFIMILGASLIYGLGFSIAKDNEGHSHPHLVGVLVAAVWCVVFMISMFIDGAAVVTL